MTGSTPEDGRPLEPTQGGDASTPPEPGAPPPPATGVPPTPDAPPPDAPTQRTGIISAAPVGWAAPEQPAAPSADQPVVAWAPPAAAPTAVPSTVGLGLVIAGTFTRLVAFAIDGLFLFLITFVIGYVLGYYNRESNSTTTALIVNLASILVGGVYFILLWRSGWHATIGMRLMRIRVLGALNGATLGLDAAIIRWLALTGIVQAALLIPVATSAIGLVSFIWLVLLLLTTATDKLHQGIHDRWAGSVVVQPAPGGSGAAIIGCLVLIAIFLIVPFVLAALLSDAVRDILSQVGQSI